MHCYRERACVVPRTDWSEAFGEDHIIQSYDQRPRVDCREGSGRGDVKPGARPLAARARNGRHEGGAGEGWPCVQPCLAS